MTAPNTAPSTYTAALAGWVPAEALPTTSTRDQLIRTLHSRGWTDVQIAQHTRWSTYTVGRLRSRLGLPPNRCTRQEVA